MWNSEFSERETKIRDCLRQLENLHQEILKDKTETNEWRELAEKSLAQQISVLRLWQGESRLSNNLKIAIFSTLGAVLGYAIHFLIRAN